VPEWFPSIESAAATLYTRAVAENSGELLKRVLDLAARTLNDPRLAQARRRQADTFAWRESDYIPIVFAAPIEALEGLPEFDWAEQFADPAASLYMQVKTNLLPLAASGCDYVPAVRADTGVINGPTILGAPYATPAHTKPVVTAHVPKEALDRFEVPDDVRPLGVMPVMVRHTRHHLEALARAGLGGRIGVHHCDLQGPFDIAAQARGHDEIFLDLYTDAEFVRRLMEKCTSVYIKMARLSKQLAGDPPASGHANEYWMERGSVRLCDDSGILVGPDLYGRHLAGYIARALEPFGGGWIHYCGGVPDGNRPEGLHLHQWYCSTPLVRGVQFTTARDLPGEVRRLHARRVVYLGGLPRGRDEPLANYFRRALSLCPDRRGMIFHADVRAGEHAGAMDAWHRLQDEVLK
jgi:hypothetical protein